MKKSKIQNPKSKSLGFTLVEILVAMAIFSIVTSVAIGVFATAMKSQRKILAQQQLLDQTSYALEYMSRAIRMAKKDLTPGSCIGINLNYLPTHVDADGIIHGIKFKNHDGVCQEFYLGGERLKENKGGADLALVAAGLKVTNFKIIPSGWDQTDNFQPAVTIFLDIEGKEGAEIKIQTTISQRNIDVKY